MLSNWRFYCQLALLVRCGFAGTRWNQSESQAHFLAPLTTPGGVVFCSCGVEVGDRATARELTNLIGVTGMSHPIPNQVFRHPRLPQHFSAETPEHPQSAFHRSEEHTSELQSPCNLVCRLLLEKK